MAKVEVPLQEKVLLSMEETAAVMGVCRDLIYRLALEIDPLTRKPRLHSVRIGRRRLVSRRALELFVEHEEGE